MNKLISIGVFEEDQYLLSLLQTSLALDRYIVSAYSFRATVLEFYSAQWEQTQSFPYDLLIIEISSTELVGKTFAAFKHIATSKNIPIILLTETTSDELRALSEQVTVLPVFFRRLFPIFDLFTAIEKRTGVTLPFSVPMLQIILQWQHEQCDIVLQTEQHMIHQKDEWLNQRQEWLQQRQTWLNQRDAWLSQKFHTLNPQYAWLDEQHLWIEQQQHEINQQVQWLQDQRIWLSQRQNRLDHLKLQLPFAKAQ